MCSAKRESDEFFVGYLPTPARSARLLRRVMLIGVVGVLLLGALIAARQRDPGGGVWDLDQEVTLEGVLYASPYPMLLTRSGARSEIVLLVGDGKRGADGDEIAKLDRYVVRASGHLLRREGRALLELSEGPAQMDAALHPAMEFSAAVRVDLVGEIADFKCFGGAMKPGDGKTHKACAALCLRGGIPSVLVTRDERGSRFYLLSDEHGSGLSGAAMDEAIALCGEPVALRGDLIEAAGVSIVRVSPGGIRRVRP